MRVDVGLSTRLEHRRVAADRACLAEAQSCPADIQVGDGFGSESALTRHVTTQPAPLSLDHRIARLGKAEGLAV